jgi:hypothetical protein
MWTPPPISKYLLLASVESIVSQIRDDSGQRALMRYLRGAKIADLIILLDRLAKLIEEDRVSVEILGEYSENIAQFASFMTLEDEYPNFGFWFNSIVSTITSLSDEVYPVVDELNALISLIEEDPSQILARVSEIENLFPCVFSALWELSQGSGFGQTELCRNYANYCFAALHQSNFVFDLQHKLLYLSEVLPSYEIVFVDLFTKKRTAFEFVVSFDLIPESRTSEQCQ